MSDIEVSVVMPCLNEAATVGICVEKAIRTMKHLGISGEVIISDNGSSDGSQEIASKAGAVVVNQPIKGYGSAYQMGFAHAKGKYIVMGDSDDSYDWTDIDRFVQPLRDGYDMVMGTRIGGKIEKGAMPFTHRYLGVPVLTTMLNVLFGGKISDAHCGMRSFTKEGYGRMRLETTGMEYASEMIIKAKQAGLRIFEIPITLHPDGRPGKPHLKSFKDGWRHVRFMLNFKPGVLYALPGWILLAAGIGGVFGGVVNTILGNEPNLSAQMWGTAFVLSAMAGMMLLMMSVIAFAKNYTGFFPRTEKFTEKFFRNYDSGQWILSGLFCVIAGLIIILGGKLSLPGFFFLGLLLTAVGLVTMFAAFLLGQMNVFGKE